MLGNMENSKKLAIKILFLLLGFLAIYIIFYNLGTSPLDNWDEAWYGEITKNMITSHDFIIPHWNKAVLLDKAPFYMWITVLFSLFLGLSEFSIRFTSAISGTIIIFWVTYYTYKNYGLIPSLVSYSSITLNNIFVFRARSGNLDSLTTLLIFISYFVIISKYKYRLLFLGFLFGIIYLTRTSFVVFPFSIFVLHEVCFKRDKLIQNTKHYILLALIFIFLTGLWLLIGYQKEGVAFINYYVLHSDQNTALGISWKNFNLDDIFFSYYSLQRRLFFLFVFGLIVLIPKLKKQEYLLQFLFATMLIALLMFSQRTSNWYLMPSMPFWSLVIGYGTYKFIKLFKQHTIVPLLIVVAVSYISYRTFTQNIVPILHSISAAGEAASGKYIDAHAGKNDTIARLDHLYPTMIYYANRKVLASPLGAGTGSYFLSRNDLIISIKQKKIRWVVGQKEVTNNFLQSNPTIKNQMIQINPDEFVLKFF